MHLPRGRTLHQQPSVAPPPQPPNFYFLLGIKVTSTPDPPPPTTGPFRGRSIIGFVLLPEGGRERVEDLRLFPWWKVKRGSVAAPGLARSPPGEALTHRFDAELTRSASRCSGSSSLRAARIKHFCRLPAHVHAVGLALTQSSRVRRQWMGGVRGGEPHFFKCIRFDTIEA